MPQGLMKMLANHLDSCILDHLFVDLCLLYILTQKEHNVMQQTILYIKQ